MELMLTDTGHATRALSDVLDGTEHSNHPILFVMLQITMCY